MYDAARFVSRQARPLITEPDVAITDWILAVEATALAVLASRAKAGTAWVAVFASIAAAGLLGGIAHGFFSGAGGPLAVGVWRATLLALGVTSAAVVIAGVSGIGGERAGRRTAPAAVAGWLVYAAVVLFVADDFEVAVAAYAPAAIFLLGVFARHAARHRSRGALAGACGVLVLFAGSWVQWRGLALHPVYFTHNAVYHVIEMVALPLLYAGACALRTPRR